MNTSLLNCCIAVQLLCATVALARIGETEAQIETRYGRPIKIFPAAASTLKLPGSTIKVYKTGDVGVVVVFFNGFSGSERYLKASRGKLTLSEIEAILAANGGQKEWSETERKPSMTSWSLNDLIARFDKTDGHLVISSKKFLDAMHAADKADANARLRNF